jgi:hypothetical protein
VLDRYFGNVCELDLIFNFHKAYHILDELLIAGELPEGSHVCVDADASGFVYTVRPPGADFKPKARRVRPRAEAAGRAAGYESDEEEEMDAEGDDDAAVIRPCHSRPHSRATTTSSAPLAEASARRSWA